VPATWLALVSRTAIPCGWLIVAEIVRAGCDPLALLLLTTRQVARQVDVCTGDESAAVDPAAKNVAARLGQHASSTARDFI
jgi:hypothetical protein